MLREGGLEIGPRRIADALRGLDAIDLARQEDVYWTLRQTLVARREELETFDRAFNAWFLRVPAARRSREVEPPRAPARDARAGRRVPGRSSTAARSRWGPGATTSSCARATSP